MIDFSDIVRGVVDDVIAEFVVLPNRIAIPLTDVDPYKLKYPLPDVSNRHKNIILIVSGIIEKGVAPCCFTQSPVIFVTLRACVLKEN